MFPIFRALSTLVVGVLLACTAGCDPQKAKEVRQAYDDVMDALNAEDGKTAVSMLTQSSIASYDRCIQLARTGTADQIRMRPANDRVNIVAMRNRLTQPELASLDGRAYLILAIDRGWKSGGNRDIELGKIKFAGSSASAEVLVRGRPTEHYYDFDLVDDTWMLDWTRVADLNNTMIAHAAANEHTSEDNMILRWESEKTGRQVKREIFDRVR